MLARRARFLKFENAPKWSIWRILGKPQFTVKQCYLTDKSIIMRQKLDILGDFNTLWVWGHWKSRYWGNDNDLATLQHTSNSRVSWWPDDCLRKRRCLRLVEKSGRSLTHSFFFPFSYFRRLCRNLCFFGCYLRDSHGIIRLASHAAVSFLQWFFVNVYLASHYWKLFAKILMVWISGQQQCRQKQKSLREEY